MWKRSLNRIFETDLRAEHLLTRSSERIFETILEKYLWTKYSERIFERTLWTKSDSDSQRDTVKNQWQNAHVLLFRLEPFCPSNEAKGWDSACDSSAATRATWIWVHAACSSNGWRQRMGNYSLLRLLHGSASRHESLREREHWRPNLPSVAWGHRSQLCQLCCSQTRTPMMFEFDALAHLLDYRWMKNMAIALLTCMCKKISFNDLVIY